MELDKRFNFKDVDAKWAKAWVDNNYFHAEPSDKASYVITIPPPNVTGILHMGHALNNTLQDIIIRYKRMKGFETCWMPGTDHAGIATQNVVEKELAKEGTNRHELGREKLLERLWDWKKQYGDTIIHQLEKIGASCDYERTRFTMDDGYSEAVLKVFVELYKKDLIYRGERLINWCPRCHTALSDEEAEHHESQGHLYHFKYPYKDDSSKYVIIATTRPETMLGDTAVAVNPKDKRYKDLIGKTLVLPLMNREIPVIVDEYVDMEFGTGALKVTPGHDPNDFELGQKHNLEIINIFNEDATINANGGDFEGQDRFEAREAIVDTLREQKLLEKIEEHTHAIGHCYRCHTVVEPYLSKQWFVKMAPLAKPALDVVKKGKVKFYPDRWTKVYTNWMENIRDWCISRQIWWGHRIPVWYKRVHLTEDNWSEELCSWGWDSFVEGNWEDENVHVQLIRVDNGEQINPKDDPLMPVVKETEGEYDIAICTNNDHFITLFEKQGFKQDEDVLDTWFSSWLWPFATFGWPQTDKDTKFFYPGDALFTASEIIFFWVARMIMAGIEFMGDIPFKNVYIHGTVRDTQGRKMSKSLGNAIDPLEIVDEYGGDALRFSLIINSGQDLYISKDKFEIGRNFANKIWNASRLILMNVDQGPGTRDKGLDRTNPQSLIPKDLPSKWILSRFHTTLQKVSDAIEGYKYSEAESLIYEFFWNNFCDWYLEIIKDKWNDEGIQNVAMTILERSLKMMHPFIPFVTEEVWEHINKDKGALCIQPWPEVEKKLIDKKSEDKMQTMIDLITALRNIRATWNIKNNQAVSIQLSAKGEDAKTIEVNEALLKSRGNISEIITDNGKRDNCATAVIGKIKCAVPLGDLIDIDKEKKRIEKQIESQKKAKDSLAKRLKNKNFLDKAPEDIVAKEKERLKTLEHELDELEAVIGGLK